MPRPCFSVALEYLCMLALTVGLCSLLPGIPAAHAEDGPGEEAVKAAFVYNFTKFVDWPEAALPATGNALTLCVFGNRPLSGRLEALQGKTTQGREIRVIVAPEERDQCQLVFIGQTDARALRAIVQPLSGRPVLTVGDHEDFIGLGGIIGLKLSAGRIRFDINLQAARASGLHINSQLLQLADRVLQ